MSRSSLDTMTHEELCLEVERLTAALAAAAATPPDPYGGLLAIALHVGGAAHRGTARRLVRCATAGEYADRWMVQVGDELVTRDGGRLQARAFAAIRPALQERVAWPSLEEAHHAAVSATVSA